MHGHADRAGLVRKRPGHGLADPPGGVGRELVAAAPVELLDGADEPQRSLLDQVQEGQALVPVVLRDRDDQAQVGLDHPLLRLHVAALDPLGELDLLGCGQERVPAGLAQEELERVGRRLVGDLRRRLRRLLGLLGLWGLLDDVDAALLELALERLALHFVQFQRLEDLCQLGMPDRTRLLGNLEQIAQVLAAEDRLDLSRRHPASCLSPNTGDAKRVLELSRWAGASLYRIPHPCWNANAREQALCQVGVDRGAGPSRLPRAPRSSYPQVGPIAVEMWKKEKSAKSVKLCSSGSCNERRPALVSPLRRARSASRAKPILRAVAGRRKSPGAVDGSETGSANDLAQRSLRVPRRQIVFWSRPVVEHDGPQAVEMWKKENSANCGKLCVRPPCKPPPATLLSSLRRARSASRAKQILRAVAGRRKSPGSVDESEIGSANELAQRCLRVPRRQFVFVDRNGLPRADERHL